VHVAAFDILDKPVQLLVDVTVVERHRMLEPGSADRAEREHSASYSS
jgi:hypothetical protein